MITYFPWAVRNLLRRGGAFRVVFGVFSAGDIEGENHDEGPHEYTDLIPGKDAVEKVSRPQNHEKDKEVFIHIAVRVNRQERAGKEKRGKNGGGGPADGTRRRW